VDLFLQKKISFLNIHKLTKKIISLKEFDKFKHKRPKNIQDILDLDTYVRLKTQNLSVEYN
jgi:1-deoxy-D-xylulose-5-phosphate reductoisomerase